MCQFSQTLSSVWTPNVSLVQLLIIKLHYLDSCEFVGFGLNLILAPLYFLQFSHFAHILKWVQKEAACHRSLLGPLYLYIDSQQNIDHLFYKTALYNKNLSYNILSNKMCR